MIILLAARPRFERARLVSSDAIELVVGLFHAKQRKERNEVPAALPAWLAELLLNEIF